MTQPDSRHYKLPAIIDIWYVQCNLIFSRRLSNYFFLSYSCLNYLVHLITDNYVSITVTTNLN